MAKVRVEGLAEISKQLKRDLRIAAKKLFRNVELRRKVGEIIVQDIKKNANFGAPEKNTLKWRERYDPINNTDPAYQRNKLNAVFTGELLEDLKKNIKANTIKFEYVLEHSKKRHKKYQGVTKKIGSRSPYRDISEGLVEKLGYNYFILKEQTREKITDLVREEFYKLLSQ